MKECRLCGLVVDEIPADAFEVGKLHRFADGTHHLFEKLRTKKIKRPPRNPDKEAPPMGTNAKQVPR